MADKPITLSKALQDYITATGKTLADIERETFLKAGYMGGLGYLELVQKGQQGHTPLDGHHDDYGPQLLAAYLIAERAKLGLAQPPAKSAATPAVTTPVVTAPTLPKLNRRGRKRRKTPRNE